MKILDTQTGDIQEYGADGHDSLRVSQDGRTLSYYNLQNGDGSAYGDYRFVCDDNKVPAESETADARHANVYFNIGGWCKRPHGEWIRTGSLGNGNAQYECSNCHHGDEHAESQEVPYCWHCGAEMKGGKEE